MITISLDVLEHVIGGALTEAEQPIELGSGAGSTTAAMSSQALKEASQPVAGVEIPGTGGQIFRGGGSSNAWRSPGM